MGIEEDVAALAERVKLLERRREPTPAESSDLWNLRNTGRLVGCRNGDLVGYDFAAGEFVPVAYPVIPGPPAAAPAAGPSCRVFGRGATAPFAPSRAVEHQMRFRAVDFIDTDFFTFTPDDPYIYTDVAGYYFVSAQLGWSESAGAVSTPVNDTITAWYLNFLGGARVMHIGQGDGLDIVIDSHKSPVFNPGITTCEGSTVLRMTAGDRVLMLYEFFMDSALSSAMWPTIVDSGRYWPSMSLTYLGPLS